MFTKKEIKMNIIELRNLDKDAVSDLAKKIALQLIPGDVILLRGQLGAGKTFFTTELCKSLGVKTIVNSPSYVLLNEYAGKYKILHYDLYRLSMSEEAFELGILDNIDENITIIEWPEIIESYIDKPVISIFISMPEEDTDLTELRNFKIISYKKL